MKTIKLGSLAGLKLMARPSTILGALLLWGLLSWAGGYCLNWGWGTAVLAALIATLLHYLGELWHQLGHAWAAKQAGWPMSGVLFIWALAASLYPSDEPELPARIHIRRALGGPAASLLLTLLAGLLALALRGSDGLLWPLAAFLFLDNLLVFTLGAFLPLGFTDGSALLRYWPRRHEG